MPLHAFVDVHAQWLVCKIVGCAKVRSMTNQRLQLALDQLKSADWRRLELFASEFLVSEFPNLRTSASPSGDGGRDAEIITFRDEPIHALQYSVTPNWASKIRETVKRLKDTNPSVQILTYATNIQIGADADELKAELKRKYKIFVDIRDKSYFLERFRNSPGTEKAAEALAVDFVDPLLAQTGVIKKSTSMLTGEEARAALVLLSLQLKDDTQEKGLTKLSFEALVRSVLMDTDVEHRMSRDELFSRVRSLVPHDATQHIDELTQSAIDRLKRRFLRHYPREDEFCLTHEESARVKAYRSQVSVLEAELQLEIQRIVQTLTCSAAVEGEVTALEIRSRRILEQVLYSRAEFFAGAVLAGNMAKFATVRIQEVVLKDQSKNPPRKGSREADPDLVTGLIREILISKSDQIQNYLHDLSNAYTLMAFLRATPDVQSAIKKIFAYGEIFLDTTVLLPLLAEELLGHNVGEFQKILTIATEAGIEFFVTDGVLEELSSHILRGLAYSRMHYANWEGGIPFIFEVYVRAGENPNNFARWTEIFMGDSRPIDDLGTYLRERFGIARVSLDENVQKAPSELRQAVDQIWYEIHEKRREKHRTQAAVDPLTIIRLAKHDTENYVGVVQKRFKETASPLGYSAWWLTFDRMALTVAETLRTKYGIEPPASPILSLDFLAQCLALGSIRSKVPKEAAQVLPMMIEPRMVSFLTKELLDEAQRIRKEMEGTPEHVISRKVRDFLDAARQRMGPMSIRGVEAFYDQIVSEI